MMRGTTSHAAGATLSVTTATSPVRRDVVEVAMMTIIKQTVAFWIQAVVFLLGVLYVDRLLRSRPPGPAL
jgi:hypothetical protein